MTQYRCAGGCQYIVETEGGYCFACSREKVARDKAAADQKRLGELETENERLKQALSGRTVSCSGCAELAELLDKYNNLACRTAYDSRQLTHLMEQVLGLQKENAEAKAFAATLSDALDKANARIAQFEGCCVHLNHDFELGVCRICGEFDASNRR